MSSRVVHFEIPCDNPQQTMKFFVEVFGWTFQQFDDLAYFKDPDGNIHSIYQHDPSAK